jgi:hypothetical protein
MRRIAVFLTLCLGLAACGAEPVWAPEEEVQRAVYSNGEPPSLTLITVISNETDAGAHTGLLINGSQRVVWDPAGTWWNPGSPERNDVHYGMHPAMYENYIDYHARETFRVVTQTVQVAPETAERIMLAAKNYGAAPKGYCARTTSEILQKDPAFSNVRTTFLPKQLMAAFDAIPGVQKQVIYDDSPDYNKDLLLQQGRG